MRNVFVLFVAGCVGCSSEAGAGGEPAEMADATAAERERVFAELREDEGAVHSCEFAAAWWQWLDENDAPVWYRERPDFRGYDRPRSNFFNACAAHLSDAQADCVAGAGSSAAAECCFAGTELETEYHAQSIDCPGAEPSLEQQRDRVFAEMAAMRRGETCAQAAAWVDVLGTVNFRPRKYDFRGQPLSSVYGMFAGACGDLREDVREGCLANALTDGEIECCLLGTALEPDLSDPDGHTNSDPLPVGCP